MMTRRQLERHNELDKKSHEFGAKLAKTVYGVKAQCLGSGTLMANGKMRYTVWFNSTTKGMSVPQSAHWDSTVLDKFIAENKVDSDSKERAEFDRLREKFCGKPCDGD